MMPRQRTTQEGGLALERVLQMVIGEFVQIEARDDADQLDRDIIKNGGDCEIDSIVAEVIIARLEQRLGGPLAGPSDLEPEQLTSIRSLGTLIATRASESQGPPLGASP